MKWKQFTIKTTTQAEDLVTSLLYDIGVTNVEVRDLLPVLSEEEAAIFEDVMPEVKEDDGQAEIVFYTDEDVDEEDFLQQIRTGLEELASFVNIGSGEILESETEDKDWVNNWKEHFSPFVVDDILIKPTWTEMPEGCEDKILLEIDPGTAFGTGSHETTKLCIHGIEKYLKQGDRVLDVGTGSGILGIICLKKGASFVTGTDIDPLACEAAEENILINGLSPESFEVVSGNILEDKELQDRIGDETYDLVLANILADVIIALQKEVVRHIKKGGIFVTSGIINLKEEQVREALIKNPDLEILETVYEGEWVSFVLRKR